MVKKIILTLLVIWLALVIFAPKREIYYAVEAQLLKEDLVISNEDIEEGLFTLTLKHPEFYVKGIKIAEAERIDFFTLLFYSTLSAKNIRLDASLQQWAPREISSVSAVYSVWAPQRIDLKLSGSFGEARGYIAVSERKVHLDLTETLSIGALQHLLRKGEKGWYYETSF